MPELKHKICQLRNMYFARCCGSRMFIPDPNFFHPGSRIRLKELKYFNPKKWFRRTQNYDPGFSSRIRIPDPDPDFLPISDPEIKKAPDPGSRIRIRNLPLDISD
jgi:hypothetical protein